MHPLTDISNTWFHGSYSSGLLQINSWCKRDIQLRVICIIACEQALLFRRVKRVSRERASERWSREGPRKGELTTIISHKFHLYFTQTKGNTIGWKMTFRKSKLIDNRLSWHPLRLYVKFGFSGVSDWYRELVSALKADGLVWSQVAQARNMSIGEHRHCCVTFKI